jgi:hypothetical protein
VRLKSVLNALLLTFGLAAVSYAGVYDYNPSQASNGNYARQGQYSYIHNAFYFEASLGLQYLNISDEKKDEEEVFDESSRNIYETDFSGMGPEFSARFGGIISSRVALFCLLGISSMKTADYEYVERQKGKIRYVEKNSEGGIRFAIGGGVNVYFVRDPSNPLYGLYAGASFAIAYFNLGDDDSYFDEERRTRPLDEAYFSQSAASVGFEFGKLWYMTDMWNVGAGVQMAFDSPDRTDEKDENIYYTLAFKIMIVRK